MASVNEMMKTLLEAGKDKGHVTFEEVHACLCDDADDPEALDKILRLLEQHGLEVIDEE